MDLESQDIIDIKQKQGITDSKFKQKVKEIFIGRYWFSNVAYFNEMKRYLKLSLLYFNDMAVQEQLGDLAFDLEGIKEESPNHKISAQNFDLVAEGNSIIDKVTREFWMNYHNFTEPLIDEMLDCVDGLVHSTKKQTILEELDIIAKSYISNHDEENFKNNFLPFQHHSDGSPIVSTHQENAYSMSYLLPKTCYMALKNRGVHPDFDNDHNDLVFYNWIISALEHLHLDT